MFLISISYKVDLSEVDDYLMEYIAYPERYYRQVLGLVLQADPFYRANPVAYEVVAFQVIKTMPDLEYLLVNK